MSDPAKEPRKYYQPPELEVVSDGELSNDGKYKKPTIINVGNPEQD